LMHAPTARAGPPLPMAGALLATPRLGRLARTSSPTPPSLNRGGITTFQGVVPARLSGDCARVSLSFPWHFPTTSRVRFGLPAMARAGRASPPGWSMTRPSRPSMFTPASGFNTFVRRPSSPLVCWLWSQQSSDLNLESSKRHPPRAYSRASPSPRRGHLPGPLISHLRPSPLVSGECPLQDGPDVPGRRPSAGRRSRTARSTLGPFIVIAAPPLLDDYSGLAQGPPAGSSLPPGWGLAGFRAWAPPLCLFRSFLSF